MISGIKFFVCSFIHCILCLIVAQNSHTASDEPAEPWQRGYKLVHFLAQYSFLHRLAGLDSDTGEATMRSILCPLAVNLAFGVGLYEDT